VLSASAAELEGPETGERIEPEQAPAVEREGPLQRRLVLFGDHGLIFSYTGLELPDGSHHGHGDFAQLETPETDAAICAVLTS